MGPYARFCLGHRRERYGKPGRSWTWTPADDRVLQEAWREHVGKKAARVASARLKRPLRAVWTRAQATGLSRPKREQRPWTAEEEAIVERADWRSARWAQAALRRAGYRRTESAVEQKRRALNVGQDGYTLAGLAALLGVDQSTVGGWRRRGLLKAEHRQTARTAEQGDLWHISHAAARDLVVRHPHLVDLRRVPPHAHLWFIDLCSGGAGLTVEEASRPDGSAGNCSLHGHELPG